MFTAIYKYEIKYWLRQPSIYIYALILFTIAFLTITGMASEAPKRISNRFVDSPYFLLSFMRRFMMLVFLLLPAVIGVSVYRDFSSRMHHLLFAFPFRKRDYLPAKFLSAFTVFTSITVVFMAACWLGIVMPWAKPEQVGGFGFSSFGPVFFMLILPNILLLSVVVFGTVLWSRNIFSGFIAVLFVVLVQQLSGILLVGGASEWSAILDPTGMKAFGLYTQNWSVAEQNELLLPVGGWVLANRLLWLSVSAIIFYVAYRSFQFHHQAPSIFGSKKAEEPLPSIGPNRIRKINLPQVVKEFSFATQIRNIWRLSNADFKYIIKSRSFLSLVLGGLVFVLLALSTVNPRFGTESLPVTWQMLELPSMFFSGIINAMTFLYAGFLVQRDRMTNMHQLVDTCAVDNSVLLLSRFIALVKMQIVLLAMMMVGGIATQIVNGYYQFEIGQYLFHLFTLHLSHFVIWAMLALFFQSLLNKPWLGFFLLLLAPVGFIGLEEFGPVYLDFHFLEQSMFRFNQGPGGVFGLRYSDMDGYGAMLLPYFMYKIYWFLVGILLLIGAVMFWQRGFTDSFKMRLMIAKKRFKGKLAIAFLVVLSAFLGMGVAIFRDTNVKGVYFSRLQKQAALSAAEKKYVAFEFFVQPKIVSTKIEMNIFPDERQFSASGQYWLVNQSKQAIDTLVVNYVAGLSTSYQFNRSTAVISMDTIANLGHFDLLRLQEPLLPGDSLEMTFENHNEPMGLFKGNDFVKTHGTFIEDDIFPRFGNWLNFLRDAANMRDKAVCYHPTDSLARTQSVMGKDAGYIDFEAIVSTSGNQTAIAPGKLMDSWEEDDRRYFHYKTKEKIAISYLFASGDYAVAKDEWKDIDISIFYHKTHDYNIKRMMDGMKAGLEYCSRNFSPYQFDQLTMVEFSQTGGASAHGFPSVIPAGEGVGFVADITDDEEGEVDYAFGTAVHEVAHQWWGHQVIPADALGAKLVVESLAEYVNVMAKKHYRSEAELRSYLEENMRAYLQMRSNDRLAESPLILTHPSQNYIHYPKGAIAFYALSEYIGEENLNGAIRSFVSQAAFREQDHSTSLELIDFLREAVSDSLQYLITDMFETVTFYDNKVLNWETTDLKDGRFEVKVSVLVRKFRSGKDGAESYDDEEQLTYQPKETAELIYSLPLSDYIEVGIFGEEGKLLHIGKIYFQQIHNTLKFTVNEAPTAIGIDPFFKLIDKDLNDNRLGR